MKKRLKGNENFFNYFKNFPTKKMDVSTLPAIEYTPNILQMMKDFSQMMDEELEDIGGLNMMMKDYFNNWKR